MPKVPFIIVLIAGFFGLFALTFGDPRISVQGAIAASSLCLGMVIAGIVGLAGGTKL